MVTLVVIGSRDGVPLPCLDNLKLEKVFLDADPSVEGTALGEEKKSTKLYITRDERWSSVFTPSSNFNQFIGFSTDADQRINSAEPVTIQRGEEILWDLNNDFVLYVNAQGSTDAIIKGFGKKIEQCCLAFVEVEFNQQYKGAPLFGEVATTFDKKGFELLDINPVRAFHDTKIFRHKFLRLRPGRPCLFWGDAIFLNRQCILASSEVNFQIIMTILIQLGFLSLSFQLAEERNFDIKSILALIGKIERPFLIKFLPKWLRKYLYNNVVPLSPIDLTVVENNHSFVKDYNRIDRIVKF